MCTGERPFIPVQNTVRVDMMYSGPGGDCENVYHVDMGGSFTQEDLDEMLDVFQNWEQQLARGHRSFEHNLIRIVGTDLTLANSFRTDRPVTPPIQGLVPAAPLPSHCTMATGFRSGRGGRSFNGRSYWIGLTEAQVIADDVTSQEVADILALYESLRTSLTAIGRTLSIVSYCGGGVWRTQGQVIAVTHFISDGVVDSQRRRLKSRGK